MSNAHATYMAYYNLLVPRVKFFPRFLSPWEADALSEGRPTHKMTLAESTRLAADMYISAADPDDPHKLALETARSKDYNIRLRRAAFSPRDAVGLLRGGYCYEYVNDLCSWAMAGIPFHDRIFSHLVYGAPHTRGAREQIPAMFKDMLVLHAMLDAYGHEIDEAFCLKKVERNDEQR